MLSGQAELPDPNDPGRSVTHAFSARRIVDPGDGPPRRLEVEPQDYANAFSAERMPIAVIRPGDVVHTRTVDSGGKDAHDTTRALFGNPQVGPFYVVGAAPGDTLAIHLLPLRPDRDSADSLDAIVGRAQGPWLAAHAIGLGKPKRWTLDLQHGVATPADASPALAGLRLPLRPMLGGLAVAPGFGSPAVSTGDTGRTGGNMDFNAVVEGNTVYLPVQQPGALLYLGDAHALQGDGETSQYALETSMEVDFSVSVVKRRTISTPRVESPTELMVLGQAGSLDDALRVATTGMVQWLQQDYALETADIAQILGAASASRRCSTSGCSRRYRVDRPRQRRLHAECNGRRAPAPARPTGQPGFRGCAAQPALAGLIRPPPDRIQLRPPSQALALALGS